MKFFKSIHFGLLTLMAEFILVFLIVTDDVRWATNIVGFVYTFSVILWLMIFATIAVDNKNGKGLDSVITKRKKYKWYPIVQNLTNVAMILMLIGSSHWYLGIVLCSNTILTEMCVQARRDSLEKQDQKKTMENETSKQRDTFYWN